MVSIQLTSPPPTGICSNVLFKYPLSYSNHGNPCPYYKHYLLRNLVTTSSLKNIFTRRYTFLVPLMDTVVIVKFLTLLKTPRFSDGSCAVGAVVSAGRIVDADAGGSSVVVSCNRTGDRASSFSGTTGIAETGRGGVRAGLRSRCGVSGRPAPSSDLTVFDGVWMILPNLSSSALISPDLPRGAAPSRVCELSMVVNGVGVGGPSESYMSAES